MLVPVLTLTMPVHAVGGRWCDRRAGQRHAGAGGLPSGASAH
jgi:hypothetical protein